MLAQHKNKCYCQNGKFCCCPKPGEKIKSAKATHKFVKFYPNKNKYSSSHSSTFTTSTCYPQTETTSFQTPSTPTHYSQLTERRELYERSKGIFNQMLKSHAAMEQGLVPFPLRTHDILGLQKFRLNNADECFSVSSKYSMLRKHTSKDPKKVAEDIRPIYKRSNRGLLEICDDQSEGSSIKKVASVTNGVNTQLAVRDVLNQKLKAEPAKEKFIKKALCLPESSLALKYQKTY